MPCRGCVPRFAVVLHILVSCALAVDGKDFTKSDGRTGPAAQWCLYLQHLRISILGTCRADLLLTDSPYLDLDEFYSIAMNIVDNRYHEDRVAISSVGQGAL